MNLEHATLAILLALFVAAEIYRYTRGVRGVIVSQNDLGLPLPVSSVEVRLDGGKMVTASLSCCTACLGHLRIGDQVRVSNSKDGYVVDLPWSRQAGCKAAGSAGC